MLPSVVQRFGQQAVALTAGTIDLLNIFDVIEWSGEQVSAVNLVAVLVWSVIFGDAVRQLNAAGDA